MAAIITARVSYRSVEALYREFPRIVNAEMNRAFRRVASQFSREFVRAKLQGPGAVYRVRRKGRQQTGGNRVKVATKFALAGFKSRLEHQESLKLKRLILDTSNPLLVIREKGGVIRPRRGTAVRGQKGVPPGSRRRIPYLAVRLRRRRRGKIQIRLVRQVVVQANLGYYAAWRAYKPQILAILAKAASESARRVARRRAA